MARILLVEDELKVRRSLQKGLREQGYEVTAAADGHDGGRLALEQSFDCIVLDLMLPGRDGFSILRELRDGGRTDPVIILTARGGVADRVEGLDGGADDYLAKPFAFAELLARIRVCLRRGATAEAVSLRDGPLELDCIRRCARLEGVEIELTTREYELLLYFMKHRHTTVTRDMLARDVWKEPAGNLTNIVDVYVKYLRDKIERPNGPHWIQTVRGVGYRFGSEQ